MCRAGLHVDAGSMKLIWHRLRSPEAPAAWARPAGPLTSVPAHQARTAPVVADGLTKSYAGHHVVRNVSFRLRRGEVTCLLGPNGAGKSTVIRMLLGLTTPSAGCGTVEGSPYRSLQHPLTVVGSMLEGPGAHPGRSGRTHLTALAYATGIDQGCVDSVLEQVDLQGAAHRRVGGYSLGMRQRLGLAAALLGDPLVLVLDEPGNGLDPASQVWLRRLLRDQATLGRTVLISTHLLPEVSAIADRVLIIAEGRLVADATPSQLSGGGTLEEAYLRLVGDGKDAARPQR